jgi:hypothetical protein
VRVYITTKAWLEKHAMNHDNENSIKLRQKQVIMSREDRRVMYVELLYKLILSLSVLSPNMLPFVPPFKKMQNL